MAAFLLASVFFGVMAVAVRVAAADMAAVQVAWVRCTGSLLLLLLVTRGQGLRPKPENRRRVALRGFLGATSITLYYVAVAWAGAGLGTLLHSTHPVWTALWSARRDGRPVASTVKTALVMNLAGAAVALGPEVALGSSVWLGGLVGLVAGALAGGAVSTAGELRQSESTALVTTWFMGTGALMLTPALVLGVPPISGSLAMTLAAVVVTSVIGQLLLHHGLGSVPATAGSLGTATSTITAAVVEAKLLGTVVPPRIFVAGALMLGAVWLVGRTPAPRH